MKYSKEELAAQGFSVEPYGDMFIVTRGENKLLANMGTGPLAFRTKREADARAAKLARACAKTQRSYEARRANRASGSRISKYEVTRQGQVDGSQHAIKILTHDNPTRDELETLIVGYWPEDTANHYASDKRISGQTLTAQARQWYAAAYMNELKRELRRAYNERAAEE